MTKKVIRLTESQLRGLVKESVHNVLLEFDEYAKLDAMVKNASIEALKKAGYTNIHDSNNPYTISVKVNDSKDAGRIKEILIGMLGADPYYLTVNLTGPMNNYAEIMLPAYTHTKFAYN